MAVMHSREFQSYKKTEIETASPAKLVLLLYDGALKRLNRALESLKQGALEEAHENLIKVQEILVELMLALDWKVGGDLAPRLHSLYDFMYRHLVQANIKGDAEAVSEVIKLMSTLREGWEEAYRQIAATKEPSSPSTPPSSINVQG